MRAGAGFLDVVLVLGLWWEFSVAWFGFVVSYGLGLLVWLLIVHLWFGFWVCGCCVFACGCCCCIVGFGCGVRVVLGSVLGFVF